MTAATPLFHALWMLCALGAVVFAASAGRERRNLTTFTLGLVATTGLVVAGWIPDAALAGWLTCVAATVYVLWPEKAAIPAAWGGVLGGVWIGLLRMQGLPLGLAVAAVAIVTALGAGLARWRPAFAPETVREEALLGMSVLGACVAVWSGVLDGWRAAANLTVAGPAVSDEAGPPAWTLVLVGAALMLGMAHAKWSRR